MDGVGAATLKCLLQAGSGDLLGRAIGNADVAGLVVSFISPEDCNLDSRRCNGAQ